MKFTERVLFITNDPIVSVEEISSFSLYLQLFEKPIRFSPQWSLINYLQDPQKAISCDHFVEGTCGLV